MGKEQDQPVSPAPEIKAGGTGFFHGTYSFLRAASSRFINLLPALILAMLCLRAAELAGGIEDGTAFREAALTVASALGLDLLSLARHLPVIFLLSLLFLRPRSPRAFLPGLGLLWSAMLLVQAALVQYFFQSGVPLGSDLLGYTLFDIVTTVKGGGTLGFTTITGLVVSLAVLWPALRFFSRRGFFPGINGAPILAVSLLLAFFGPKQPNRIGFLNEYERSLALNKTSYFIDDTVSYLAPSWLKRGVTAQGRDPGTGFRYLDPKYPFLHSEQTPDALGPYFKINPAAPPNFVFLIIEGLGRSFSGPGAILGSFTPKLDQLAAGGLYWENFLATQGRTFGVLPSLLGSLPFGANGLAELGERMPAHVSLLSLLKPHGYREKVYCGFKADFDNDRIFYARNGVDTIVDELSFGPGYKKSTSWGYADRELFSRALTGEADDHKEPFITIIKTATTHTPYSFIGQKDYYPRFEKYLGQLGIPENKRASYREYKDIYTSLLYLDDELARFLEEIKKRPAYANTIVVITGDHRLPEIPMASRIDRYHVPLIVLSPLLKAPARIKSVSSQFDVTPSLLAFLSHNYGIETPGSVVWLGSGLDMDPSFRNVHTIPIKQTKTNLVDFLSGNWYMNQDTLYKLGDSMQTAETQNASVMARLREKFSAYRTANDQLARTRTLMPEGTEKALAPYLEEERFKPSATSDEDLPPGLAVREVRSPESAKAGTLKIDAVFSNSGDQPSKAFLPLVVLMNDDAKELSESYGQLQSLLPNGSVTLQLPIRSEGIKPGRYFMAVIPSDPETGKSIGAGKYRIPVLLHN